MTIRTETPDDHDIVREIHLDAFPGGGEADLVDDLRQRGEDAISLVAEVEGRIVGHVLCSPMRAPFPALGLAPVAVLKSWRNRGHAAALIRSAIEEARRGDWQAMFVVGDPDYYSRFGFSADAARGFRSPYAGPYFMVLPLVSELATAEGTVDYAPPFARLG